MNSIYPWQQTVWRRLLGYVEQRRIPQALLMTGVAGLGQRHLVDVYARTLLCHDPQADGQACGHCQSCHLLDAQTHPDYLAIEPDEPGKAIGIDKIRQLIVKLALKPQFEAYRVVVVEPADNLNTASANAFLKCLEEPTERTCIVLLSEQPSRLPATIRSRCQIIASAMPDTELASDWLKAQGVDQNAKLLLDLAQGAPLLAKQYAEQQLVEVRRECFTQWLQIAQGKCNLLQAAEQWQKQERPELTVVLAWMIGWIGDIAKCALIGEGARLQNPDLKKSLQGLAERLELKDLFRFYDMLLTARSQLTTQVNKQLLLEQLLIGWSQLNIR